MQSVRTLDGGHLRFCPECGIRIYSSVEVPKPEIIDNLLRLGLAPEACADCYITALLARADGGRS